MKQRIISAILALIILIPLIFLGGIYFKVALSALSLLALKEVLDIKKELPTLIKVISYILILLMVLLNISMIIKILITIFILYVLLVFFDRDTYNIETSAYLTSFSILIIMVFSYTYIIRNTDLNILLYLLLITILTDTFAYIFGKIFGKQKLIERISPNKTIEGSVFGTIFGTLIPSIFYIYMVDPGQTFIFVISLTFILSIIGQLGDLVFSDIKRYYKIKDFSNIMPGHGGVLDRLDSIIFVIIGYIIIINFI